MRSWKIGLSQGPSPGIGRQNSEAGTKKTPRGNVANLPSSLVILQSLQLSGLSSGEVFAIRGSFKECEASLR
jgi:hypothetical protein